MVRDAKCCPTRGSLASPWTGCGKGWVFCEKKNDGLFCKRDTDWAEKSLLYSFGTKNGEKGYYALFSSSVAWVASLVVSSIGAPLAARLAIMPSLVCGMYAPPVKV